MGKLLEIADRVKHVALALCADRILHANLHVGREFGRRSLPTTLGKESFREERLQRFDLPS